MESNITTLRNGNDVTITLFLTDEDIKKYGWNVDIPSRTYEGYWWRNDSCSKDIEAQKVDGGYQWVYKIPYHTWDWFQGADEEKRVYSISVERVRDQYVLYMDLEKFYTEHPQEDKLFRYEAHQTYSTSGYVVASCQQEAERIVRAALCDGLYADEILEFDDFDFTDFDSRVEPAEGAITLSEYSCVLKRPLGNE